MADEVRDVNPSESSQEEQVVENPAIDQQTDTEQVEQTEQTSDSQEVNQESIGDDRPVENVAWEAKRKIDDLHQNLPGIIKSAMQEIQGTPQPEKPQYTKAQLRAFAEQATDSSSKVWALEEIDKLEKSERQTEMKQMFDGYTQRTQAEQQRQQATQFVAQTFPECFVDGPGGPQWNNSSPLTQRIGVYMQNPDLAKSPNGLVAAAKMAAFDLGVSANRRLQSKVKKTTAQLRKEQKKTLIAGGGAAVTSDSKGKIAKMAEEYRKTGDSNLFRELINKRGLGLKSE